MLIANDADVAHPILKSLKLTCLTASKSPLLRLNWSPCGALVKIYPDTNSLQFRLTVGITSLIVLGLGSMGFWTSLRMQQILTTSHKQSVTSTASRFLEDVALYREMYSPQKSIEQAIANRSTPTTFIWASSLDGSLLARSEGLSVLDWLRWNIPQMLSPKMPVDSRRIHIYELDGRYLVVCREALQVDNQVLGTFYVLQDVTADKAQFTAVNRSLVLAIMGTMLVIGTTAAWYVQQLLRPLQQVTQMTQNISADNLENQPIHLPIASSEVRKLVDTFNMLLERIAEALRQQRLVAERQHQFVSNVSHELRTPLTIVYGYLQSLRRRSDNLNDSQQEALTIAALETDQIIRLLQDLLDLARADDGFIPLYFESLVLSDLVMEVAGMARQYSNRQIEIITSQPLLSVYADRNRLKQVLLNLIDNAMKYSAVDTPVTVHLTRRGLEVTIKVVDQGQGIPLQQQARIFERFYRGDEARSRSGSSGYGLGLSIVKTLVEAMKGTISVRSQLGEGSVFIVTLPTAPDLL